MIGRLNLIAGTAELAHARSAPGAGHWAFGRPELERGIAHTRPELAPSIRVLQKNGFARSAPGEGAGTIRFEVRRETFAGM